MDKSKLDEFTRKLCELDTLAKDLDVTGIYNFGALCDGPVVATVFHESCDLENMRRTTFDEEMEYDERYTFVNGIRISCLVKCNEK